MSDIAIRVENLGKRYRIGQRERYYTLRDSITNLIKAPFRRFTHSPKHRSSASPIPHGSVSPTHRRSDSQQNDTIWALRGVSFCVAHGEVVGIIGRNGAGKTTLLKILSRITEPTEGYAEIYGRVGSLLEVGTGFHPELTGRENIYLSGAILGMRKAEIEKKFDEIVAFAEIEKFLDTPIKRYSSGMYVRLAFSVAAHLEPEILLVDEVLAVGDFSFQQKCMNKIQDISAESRTVLFVSHNLGAINRLCQKCIWLNGGQIAEFGTTSNIVQKYIASGMLDKPEYTQPAVLDKTMNLRRIKLVASDGQCKSNIGYKENFCFVIDYEVNSKVAGALVGIGLFTVDGTCVFVSADFDSHPEMLEFRFPGVYRSQVEIPAKWLNTGKYTVTVYVSTTNEVYDEVEALVFSVIDTGSPGSHHGVDYRKGVLQPLLNWVTTKVST